MREGGGGGGTRGLAIMIVKNYKPAKGVNILHSGANRGTERKKGRGKSSQVVIRRPWSHGRRCEDASPRLTQR